MVFNSWTYLLFLFLSVLLYWTVGRARRVELICILSVLFYGVWRWEFVFLVILSAIVDYGCSRYIPRAQTLFGKRMLLLISLIVNVGLLVFFKYTYFLVDNLGFFSTIAGGPHFDSSTLGISIILPLGISFYTFQTISYTIDVYRGLQKPITNFFEFFAYVVFWPQLVAGPILRAHEVIPQLKRQRRFELRFLTGGMIWVISGLFKKVALADMIAPYVDTFFGMAPNTMTAIDVLVAAFLFGFQIYFDFSGYSDIAIGSALMLGVVFPRNFNWPYMSADPRSFWKRWHISLSSWIRDYLYLPLTGSKFQSSSQGGIAIEDDGPKRKKSLALFYTWCIMGFWHGANWTFLLWGIYHCLLILAYRKIGVLQKLSSRPFWGWAFWIIPIMLSWVFFRAENASHAFHMLAHVVNPLDYKLSHQVVGMSNPTVGWGYLLAASIWSMMCFSYFTITRPWPDWVIRRLFPIIQFAILAFMTFSVVMLLQQKEQFIYFQF